MSNTYFTLSYKQIEVIDHERTGQNMRRLRIDTGISLRKFAKKCGFSANYIGHLELGKRNWNKQLVEMYKQMLSK